MTRLTHLYKAICNSNKHAHNLAAVNHQYSLSHRNPDLQIGAVLWQSKSQHWPTPRATGELLVTCKSLVNTHVWHEYCGNCGGKTRFVERGKRTVKNGQALWAHMLFSKPDAETETFCSVQTETNPTSSKERLCGQIHCSARSLSLVK